MNAVSAKGDIGEPAAFEIFVRVRHHEVDSLGHLNNAAYLNYIEQAAVDHAAYLGLDADVSRSMGGVFVARRHTILYLRPALGGDLLRIVTWLEEPSGARIVRNSRIYREEPAIQHVPLAGRLVTGREDDERALICEAATEWVFVNDLGRPRRIPREMAILFDGRALNPGRPS